MDVDTKDVRSVQKLLASAVSYFCEPGNANGRVVHLGTFTELVCGGFHGLALIGRTELKSSEREAIGEIGRRLLDPTPFDYLSMGFEEAWHEAAAGGCLAYLSERHAQSLHIAVPKNLRVPQRLLLGTPNKFLVEMTLLETVYESDALVDDGHIRVDGGKAQTRLLAA